MNDIHIAYDKLGTHIRELEAENKRLREELKQFAAAVLHGGQR